jgi:hypothetical protein
MAANISPVTRSGSNGGLRFKEGPYLTPKVERIMLQIARGRTAQWIADLYDVREPFVYYVARKTGFPASTLNHRTPGAGRGARELEQPW